MTEPTTDLPSADARAERHASWSELFFDLIAVAGVAALSHVLVLHLDAATIGLYAVLFLAFWLCWTTFMLYGNVAAGQTHVLRLMVGMFGLGVMAATVPGVAHTLLEHGTDPLPLNAFAIAYIATRIYGSQSWRRGQVLVDFPVVQYSGGLLPWVVSIWLDEPWKVALWAVGVGLDLLLIVVLSGHRMVAQFQARLTALSARAADRKQRRTTPDGGRRSGGGRRTVVAGVSVDADHLAERLGLFVIIVLGESVVQVVNAAAGTPYNIGLLAACAASFVLLAGMFGLSVAFGYAGLPHLRAGRIPARAALGLHCLVTGVIATIAVSLAAVVEHGGEPLSDQSRWLLCGALAGYFALGVATGVVSSAADLQRTISRIVTGVLTPILLGLFAENLRGVVLVGCLAVVVLSHLEFERRLVPIGQE